MMYQNGNIAVLEKPKVCISSDFYAFRPVPKHKLKEKHLTDVAYSKDNIGKSYFMCALTCA